VDGVKYCYDMSYGKILYNTSIFEAIIQKLSVMGPGQVIFLLLRSGLVGSAIFGLSLKNFTSKNPKFSNFYPSGQKKIA